MGGKLDPSEYLWKAKFAFDDFENVAAFEFHFFGDEEQHHG